MEIIIVSVIVGVAILSFAVGFAIGGYNAANRVIDAWRESNAGIFLAWEESNKKTFKTLKDHIDNAKSS